MNTVPPRPEGYATATFIRFLDTKYYGVIAIASLHVVIRDCEFDLNTLLELVEKSVRTSPL